MKLPILTFLLVFATHNTFSQTIYVSPSGSDSNTGSRNIPVASPEKARDMARAIHEKNQSRTVTIIFAAGTYYLTKPLELLASERALDQNLIFSGDSKNKPVFSGGYQIGLFKKVSDSLWRADVPEVVRTGVRFEQLYVNGQRAERAKFPNVGFFNPVAVKETILSDGKERRADSALQNIKVNAECFRILSSLSEQEIPQVIIRFCHNWDNTIKHLQSFNKSDSTVTIAGQGMKPWNKITKQSIFTLENFHLALDKPGEWFLEKDGTLYYKPKAGESIDNITTIAPVLEKLVVMKGTTANRVSNIIFKNISFQNSGYWLPQSGFEPSQAAATEAAAIEVDFADHIEFADCEFRHMGTYGLWLRRGTFESLIERNYFQDLGAGGIKIGETSIPKDTNLIPHNIVINNNILHQGGKYLNCAVGIAIFNGYNNQVTHNEIGDFRYTGISVGLVWGYEKSYSVRNLIANNHIHHLGWGEMSDMGGVYTLGVSPGTVVRNNLIHDIYALDYGGWGLYTDEGSSNIVMRDNLVYNCKSSGFHQHFGKDNIIANNIFANNIRSQLQGTKAEKHRSFVFKHNIVYYTKGDLLSTNWDKFMMDSDSNNYWKQPDARVLFKKENFKAWQSKGKDVHSIMENPDFVNPTDGDFRIGNKALMKKIGFEPFDYSKAGVYGTRDWVRKGKLDVGTLKAFEEVVWKGEEGD